MEESLRVLEGIDSLLEMISPVIELGEQKKAAKDASVSNPVKNSKTEETAKKAVSQPNPAKKTHPKTDPKLNEALSTLDSLLSEAEKERKISAAETLQESGVSKETILTARPPVSAPPSVATSSNASKDAKPVSANPSSSTVHITPRTTTSSSSTSGSAAARPFLSSSYSSYQGSARPTGSKVASLASMFSQPSPAPAPKPLGGPVKLASGATRNMATATQPSSRESSSTTLMTTASTTNTTSPATKPTSPARSFNAPKPEVSVNPTTQKAVSELDALLTANATTSTTCPQTPKATSVSLSASPSPSAAPVTATSTTTTSSSSNTQPSSQTADSSSTNFTPSFKPNTPTQSSFSNTGTSPSMVSTSCLPQVAAGLASSKSSQTQPSVNVPLSKPRATDAKVQDAISTLDGILKGSVDASQPVVSPAAPQTVAMLPKTDRDRRRTVEERYRSFGQLTVDLATFCQQTFLSGPGGSAAVAIDTDAFISKYSASVKALMAHGRKFLDEISPIMEDEAGADVYRLTAEFLRRSHGVRSLLLQHAKEEKENLQAFRQDVRQGRRREELILLVTLVEDLQQIFSEMKRLADQCGS